jgi:hypothetical protein
MNDMGSTRSAWSLRGIATSAGVLPKVARDAVEEGVIDAAHLTEADVVLVRVYGALKRHVWPTEVRPANKGQGLRYWEQMTIETVRAAVSEDIAPDTGLFVHDAGCLLTTDPGEDCMALFALRKQGAFYYLPLGQWIHELPSKASRSPHKPHTREDTAGPTPKVDT